MEEMKTVVRQNKDRRYSYDHTVGRDTIDGQMLWMFLTHINVCNTKLDIFFKHIITTAYT